MSVLLGDPRQPARDMTFDDIEQGLHDLFWTPSVPIDGDDYTNRFETPDRKCRYCGALDETDDDPCTCHHPDCCCCVCSTRHATGECGDDCDVREEAAK